MYVTNGNIKSVEEDDFLEGCIPETYFLVELNVSFKSKTKKEIIEKIKRFYNVNDDDILLNSCDEAGRVDIQILENEYGEKADNEEIEKWKKGNVKLYLATYTHIVQKLEKVYL